MRDQASAYRWVLCDEASPWKMTAAILLLGTVAACSSQSQDGGEISQVQRAFSNHFGGEDCPVQKRLPVGVTCLATHEQITTTALRFLKEDVRNLLARQNALFDACNVSGAIAGFDGTLCSKFLPSDLVYANTAYAHFDNCTFSGSAAQISANYSSILNNILTPVSPFTCVGWGVSDCQKPDTGSEAFSYFAAVLHTMQDFYAHTNWVENGMTAPFSGPLDPLSLTPYSFLPGTDLIIVDGFASGWSIHRHKAANTYPSTVLPFAKQRGTSYRGLISGSTSRTWMATNPDDSPYVAGHRITHAELAKDDPSFHQAQFVKAVGLTARQTANEWCRLVFMVRKNYRQEGDWKLFDDWVDDEIGASCGGPTDLQSIPFSGATGVTAPDLNVGDTHTYELQFANIGSAAAFGTTFELDVSGSVASVSHPTVSVNGGTPTPCDVTGTKVRCRLPAEMPPNASATVDFTVQASSSAGVIGVDTTATSHVVDSDSTNNSISPAILIPVSASCPLPGQVWNPVAGACQCPSGLDPTCPGSPPGSSLDPKTCQCACNDGELRCQRVPGDCVGLGGGALTDCMTELGCFDSTCQWYGQFCPSYCTPYAPCTGHCTDWVTDCTHLVCFTAP